MKIGQNGYALPLSKAPDGVQFLKLKFVGTNHYVIIPMTNDGLKKQSDDGAIGWEGDNKLDFRAYHLGIYIPPLRPDFPRAMSSSTTRRSRATASAGGSGIGHVDDAQGYCWDGLPVGPSAFEISVKAGPLTEKEAKALLGKK